MTSTVNETHTGYRSPTPEIGIAERYTSKEYAALEAERLWPRVWQMACHLQEIPEVGDYIEYEIGRDSILVVRTDTTTVKAFHNVCLHRGMRLKLGAGNAGELRCRSHSWCWNLDGTLKEVVDPQDFDGGCTKPERLGLPECRVEIWSGLVFINMDTDAPPLTDFLGVVPARTEAFRLSEMRMVSKVTTIVECNWKLAHEAFIETYHAIGTHPQILRYLDDTSLEYEQNGIHGMHRFGEGAMGRPSKRFAEGDFDRGEVLIAAVTDLASFNFYSEEEVEAMRGLVDVVNGLPEGTSLAGFFADMRRAEAANNGLDLSSYSDRDLSLGPLWNVFPNVTLPCNAGTVLVFRFRPNGSDPETSLWDKYTFKLLGEHEQPTEPENVFVADWRDYKNWGIIIEQDLTNLPIWQLGVRSRGWQGPIWGRSDGNVANLHRALDSYLSS
jgi:phenylpropionate dioxygenase-like ring-hydroxylating dioxygenase large terminal subunit